MAPKGQVSFLPFTNENIQALFGASSATAYLFEYLHTLGASGVLAEHHYVDRHFLDDYAHYYSRSFSAPPPHCGRMHFFALTADDLSSTFDGAYASTAARDAAERKMQAAYLGFVVARPLKGARIGRTVLKTYPVDGRRHYEVVRPYRVHVAGIHLVVEGLAYQQQDRGAAVCASTALWSALQRVAHVAGHRTPTPSAITRAANSPFPASSGLDVMRMAAALSSLGYIADHFAPLENRALFRAKVVAALRSQLPVILLVTRKYPTGAGEVRTGHAVTITGFSEPPSIVDVPSTRADRAPMRMKGGSVEVVYVHDDNLGSHAHYELFDKDDETDADGYKRLMLRRGRTSPAAARQWWQVDEWAIYSALIPKPDKLRLSIERLFYLLLELRRLFEQVFPGLELHYGPRFASGVEYKRKLLDQPLDRASMRMFHQVALPRHIGVLSVLQGDTLLVDTLVDVSEVERDPNLPSVLGFVAPGVPINSPAWKHLHTVTTRFQWPAIFAPVTP